MKDIKLSFLAVMGYITEHIKKKKIIFILRKFQMNIRPKKKQLIYNPK